MSTSLVTLTKTPRLHDTQYPCQLLRAKGSCSRGEKCYFKASHNLSQDELRKLSVCKDFAAGKHCRMFDCIWLHERED
ncbi:hypothetical protein DL93DRAFT_2072959, partial [Clavulina sp. PMI_390]